LRAGRQLPSSIPIVWRWISPRSQTRRERSPKPRRSAAPTGATPIFSCESESLDCREIPAIQAVYSIRWQRLKVRRLRSFLADLGTRMRFGAQWAGGWPDRSGAGPDQTQAAGATKPAARRSERAERAAPSPRGPTAMTAASWWRATSATALHAPAPEPTVSPTASNPTARAAATPCWVVASAFSASVRSSSWMIPDDRLRILWARGPEGCDGTRSPRREPRSPAGCREGDRGS
jgi:hypothetical protein